MVISLVTNVAAQVVVAPVREGEEARIDARLEADPRHDITARSSGLGRRRRVEKAVAVLAILSAVLACAMLVRSSSARALQGHQPAGLRSSPSRSRSSARRAASQTPSSGARSWSACRVVFAVPLAVLVAIYMSEYAGPRVGAVLPARAGRAERGPGDRRRHLHLRAARRRARPERDLRRVRAWRS